MNKDFLEIISNIYLDRRRYILLAAQAFCTKLFLSNYKSIFKLLKNTKKCLSENSMSQIHFYEFPMIKKRR